MAPPSGLSGKSHIQASHQVSHQKEFDGYMIKTEIREQTVSVKAQQLLLHQQPC